MGCATKDTGKRWPGGVIPYVIHPEMTGVNVLKQAIAFWEKNTQVRFVQRFEQGDYLHFVPDAGAVGYAYSQIGKVGGQQTLACSFSFNKRIFLHEIGHTLGLVHEQKRKDRDNFIAVNMNNVAPEQRHNFTIDNNTINTVAYDFQSIMHYGSKDFAIDNSIDVITPNDASITPAMLGSAAEPTALDIEMVNTMYPHAPVVRRSSAQQGAGTVHEIASLVLPDGKMVTAVINGSRRLQMVLWNVDDLGGIQRRSQQNDPNTGGGASHLSITQAGTNVVTAMRNASNDLYLVSWQQVGGQLERKHDSGILAGDASLVRIVALSTTRLLTACKNGSGDLFLVLWEINGDGKFTRLGDSGHAAGEVSEISLVKIRQSGTDFHVATTVRAGDGHVLVITWKINGHTITRMGDSGSSIGKATQIETTLDQHQHLVVSCKDASKNLLLISLNVSQDAATITRLHDSHSLAGTIGVNAVIKRHYGVLSAVSNGDGKLLLIKWSIDTNGQFARLGESANQAGDISLVDIVAFRNKPESPLCTIVKDGSGNLFPISWDDEARFGEVETAPQRSPVSPQPAPPEIER